MQYLLKHYGLASCDHPSASGSEQSYPSLALQLANHLNNNLLLLFSGQWSGQSCCLNNTHCSLSEGSFPCLSRTAMGRCGRLQHVMIEQIEKWMRSRMGQLQKLAHAGGPVGQLRYGFNGMHSFDANLKQPPSAALGDKFGLGYSSKYNGELLTRCWACGWAQCRAVSVVCRLPYCCERDGCVGATQRTAAQVLRTLGQLAFSVFFCELDVYSLNVCSGFRIGVSYRIRNNCELSGVHGVQMEVDVSIAGCWYVFG